MKGSVIFQGGNLIISHGEAIASISSLPEAIEQMNLAVRVSEWVLTRLLEGGPITNSVLIIHLFAPKSTKPLKNGPDNIRKDEKNVSLTIHYV